ncbi:MAG TPA: hypothetical protein VHS74_02080, partial [Solirubrobacterales bacterium]|nr:hypothetical protein [Solirubrobacterales bacterium]
TPGSAAGQPSKTTDAAMVRPAFLALAVAPTLLEQGVGAAALVPGAAELPSRFRRTSADAR